MASTALRIDIHEFDEQLARLGPVLHPDTGELMAAIGALGESQTRRRIEEEKTAPDGTPWKENWTKTPILRRTGRHLLDSVAFVSDATSAEWGATWEHASVHQEGAVIVPRNGKALAFWFAGAGVTSNAEFAANAELVLAKSVTIPARPFLGISSDNRAEISDLITDFFGDSLQEAQR